MTQPASILVVDDNTDNRRLVERMLKRRGIALIAQAQNAAECLRALEVRSFDVIVMDISMPEVSGFELCQIVRRHPHGKDVRIVACTAHASKKDAENFLQIGFDSVLSKPFLMEDLYKAIGMDPTVTL
jgi:CheY-like chemotaxis protein